MRWFNFSVTISDAGVTPENWQKAVDAFHELDSHPLRWKRNGTRYQKYNWIWEAENLREAYFKLGEHGRRTAERYGSDKVGAVISLAIRDASVPLLDSLAPNPNRP